MTLHQRIQFDIEPTTRRLPGFPAPYLIVSDSESVRYREMRAEYRRACERRPFLNHCVIAFMVGAKAFEIPVDLLQSQLKTREIAEPRHKLMAFCRVVSVGTPTLNSFKGIARAFHRHHATVIHANHKYGGQIAEAIQGATA